jgi:hypothetical protein
MDLGTKALPMTILKNIKRVPGGGRAGTSTEHEERNAQDANVDIRSDDRGEDIPRSDRPTGKDAKEDSED